MTALMLIPRTEIIAKRPEGRKPNELDLGRVHYRCMPPQVFGSNAWQNLSVTNNATTRSTTKTNSINKVFYGPWQMRSLLSPL